MRATYLEVRRSSWHLASSSVVEYFKQQWLQTRRLLKLGDLWQHHTTNPVACIIVSDINWCTASEGRCHVAVTLLAMLNVWHTFPPAFSFPLSSDLLRSIQGGSGGEFYSTYCTLSWYTHTYTHLWSAVGCFCCNDVVTTPVLQSFAVFSDMCDLTVSSWQCVNLNTTRLSKVLFTHLHSLLLLSQSVIQVGYN